MHGSGKTTIALHRIAYLIYNYGKEFFPEEFLIIAPNKFFLNYISNVLPDLGVERVSQMTYEEVAFQIIGREYKIEDPNHKLSLLIDSHLPPKQKKQAEIMANATLFKSTVRFKNLIDEYIFEVEKRFLPNIDFEVAGRVLMTKEEISSLFYREYGYLPLTRRIFEIKKHMLNKLFAIKDELIKEIEDEAKYLISRVKFEEDIVEIQRSQIRAIYAERDEKLKEFSKNLNKHVDKYFVDNKVLDALGYYKEFLDVYFKELAGNRISSDEVKYIIDGFNANQRKGQIEMEDLAPLMYITYLIHGIKTKFELKHVVIDEAQDFSEFQFYVFKKIVKSNSMTILGDLAQGIYGYRGTNNWKKTMDIVFEGDTDLQYLTLSKTYRTTEEIMNKANDVISHIHDKIKCPLGEPVMKNGEKVTMRQFKTEEEMISQIKYRIDDFLKKGLKNIAIIGKTVGDCLILEKELSDMTQKIHMITDKDSTYDGGISIVPSYLSKGLEFDAVIITNCDDFNYTSSEVDTKLLYVCMTRAMNTLDIYSVEPLCKLLTKGV
ncbi:MAG: UvrD-helicase domain-containing protein [Clostridia bacterium]|nr:UvrD-helicase domain-containing protein [Clostridia bacterium]